MVARAWILLALVPGAQAGSPPEPPPYASGVPLPAPVIFAPGVISTGDYESHPLFAPDGRTLYYLKCTPDFGFWTLVASRFERGSWSEPEVLPFSGRYSDADPVISPDGSKLFFISFRPVDSEPNEDLDIWYVERTDAGWGEPKNLGPPINSPGNEWFPTITASGTLYFGSDREGGRGRTDIYRAKFADGKFDEPENLGDAVNTKFDEFEAYVTPDERQIIVASARAGGIGGIDLYASVRRDGAWQPLVNLGEPINSATNELGPRASPDGKYLFYMSARGFSGPLERRLPYSELIARLRGSGNGLGDIYQVDWNSLAPLHAGSAADEPR